MVEGSKRINRRVKTVSIKDIISSSKNHDDLLLSEKKGPSDAKRNQKQHRSDLITDLQNEQNDDGKEDLYNDLPKKIPFEIRENIVENKEQRLKDTKEEEKKESLMDLDENQEPSPKDTKDNEEQHHNLFTTPPNNKGNNELNFNPQEESDFGSSSDIVGDEKQPPSNPKNDGNDESDSGNSVGSPNNKSKPANLPFRTKLIACSVATVIIGGGIYYACTSSGVVKFISDNASEVIKFCGKGICKIGGSYLTKVCSVPTN